MRGKKAKALRKMTKLAAERAGMTETHNLQPVPGSKRVKHVKDSTNGKVLFSFETFTVRHMECVRALYQTAKRLYRAT